MMRWQRVVFAFVVSCLLVACGDDSASSVGDADIAVEEVARLPRKMQESSGLAFIGGSLWTINDSGNAAEIYRLSPQGSEQQTVEITGIENIDWEALAHDDEFIYIADIGNNFNGRDFLIIYRIPVPGVMDEAVVPVISTLTYLDRESGGNPASHNFDAEGLAVKGDELWLFTKNRADGNSNLYRFPKAAGDYTPASSQTLPVDSLVTAADINPVTGELVMLSSNLSGEDASYLITAPTTETGVDWSQSKRFSIGPTDQWEAVVWVGENEVILSHERDTRRYAGLGRIRFSD